MTHLVEQAAVVVHGVQLASDVVVEVVAQLPQLLVLPRHRLDGGDEGALGGVHLAGLLVHLHPPSVRTIISRAHKTTAPTRDW